MKKILFVLFLAVVFMPNFAIAESWLIQKIDGVKGALVGEDANSAVKPKEENRIDDKERADWEISIRFPVFVNPAGGDRQTALMLTDIWLYHNMSKGFLSFWGMMKSLSDVEKTKKNGSYYDTSWDYRVITAGIQWYITKQKNYNIAFYGGAGQVLAEDSEGNTPELGMAEIFGVKFDIPYRKDDPFGWNIEIVYEMIDAENKEEHITKALGDFGINSWMVGIRIPL